MNELEEIIALNLFNVSINSGEIMSKGLDGIKNAVTEIKQAGYIKKSDLGIDLPIKSMSQSRRLIMQAAKEMGYGKVEDFELDEEKMAEVVNKTYFKQFSQYDLAFGHKVATVLSNAKIMRRKK